ncbi:MAG: hypothetical protein JWM82_4378 [Myxococcales bacterium]|nr:hypothetical protein [Myxococcales bacterium]
MTRGRAVAFVALVATSSFGGCGTAYQPLPSARVGLVIHHGGAWYVKDGREVPVSAFGGTLLPLVADVPAATARASRAHHQFMVGAPLYVGGVASVVVGLALGLTPVGWIVLGAGAATGGTGLGLMGAGVSNTVDAINLHNDAVHDDAVPARP